MERLGCFYAFDRGSMQYTNVHSKHKLERAASPAGAPSPRAEGALRAPRKRDTPPAWAVRAAGPSGVAVCFFGMLARLHKANTGAWLPSVQRGQPSLQGRFRPHTAPRRSFLSKPGDRRLSPHTPGGRDTKLRSQAAKALCAPRGAGRAAPRRGNVRDHRGRPLPQTSRREGGRERVQGRTSSGSPTSASRASIPLSSTSPTTARTQIEPRPRPDARRARQRQTAGKCACVPLAPPLPTITLPAPRLSSTPSSRI